MRQLQITSAFAACVLFLLPHYAQAAEIKVVGTMKASIVQQQVLPLGSPDHIVLMTLEKGTTASPGLPLDGAAIMLAETVVIDKGNGPQTGTITLGNDRGSITNEIRGTVKTTMVDGQPHISTSGTYSMIAGTGIFAGAKGRGTYKAAFTSKTDWSGEYNGMLMMPKREAAR